MFPGTEIRKSRIIVLPFITLISPRAVAARPNCDLMKANRCKEESKELRPHGFVPDMRD